ncbi:MAG: hypothetical protein NTV28_03595 [Propionibacteriales bacterium]|nr:hypothetical protein [Propionibacteriales bacterium]
MADRPPRPPALTLTCIFVGVGCGLLLVNLVSALSSWGSIELQDAVRDALAQEPVKELGLGMDQALDYLRYAVYVGIVLTASGAVFAVYAARGHRTSRVMLTILCGIAFVVLATLGLPGLLPAAFAGLCGWSLWTPEARRWFDQVDGRPAADVPAPPPAGTDPFASRSAAPGGRPLDQASGETVMTTTPTHPSAQPAPVVPAARPRSVTVAVVTTFVSCGVVALLGLLLLLVTTVGADAYRTALTEPGLARDLVRSSGISADEMIELLRVSAIVWLVACLAGVIAALAVVRRAPAGGTALVVVAAVTIALSVFFLPLGVVTGAAAVVVIVQLRRPESRAWLSRE